jgi:CDP-diacylglycerol--serine O-phosphatidyltransferase
MLIVDLTVADWMTLAGHALVWGAVWCTLLDRLPYAIALLLVAMLVDALDGMVARRLGVARPFGRYLGSFVDLINYTVVPPIVLWKLGFDRPESLAILLVYSTCGMLRLSRFNEIGNIQRDGELAYLGLPVFWVHFALMGLYGVRMLGSPFAFRSSTALVLLVLALCFLLNRPFWKPRNYAAITAVTLAGAALFVLIGYQGAS